MGETDGTAELAALQLLEDALEQPSDRRRDFIANANVPDAVRDRALSLLERPRDASGQVRTGGAGDLIDGFAPAPERIGAYAIKDEIGRGGMGLVYLAERDTGDFEHRVAVKMILTGNLSPRLVERFAYERQALASLNHPHIARLFDGGETEDGLPYVVMELVEGRDLRAWLETENPSADERFAVLSQLLGALEYAHSRLVIHRDLTPENVIVDGDGNAKLIDFGISSFQSLRADGSAPADGFRTGQSGTPGFAAPESDRDAAPTVAIDIYAVGKLIELMFEDALTPELESIASKAAADNPEDRYDSIGDLAEAIDDYRAGRPLSEHSTATTYRIGKFVRRNAVGTTVAALFLLTVLASVVVLSISLASERQARELADERFLAVRDLSTFQLFDVYDALRQAPGNTELLNELASKAQVYLEALRQSDQTDPELRFETAQAYIRLADILGNPAGGSLGRREESQAARDTGVAELMALAEIDPENDEIRLALVNGLLAQSQFANFALDDAELAVETAERAETYARRGLDDDEFKLRALDAQIARASPLPWVGRTAEALPIVIAAEREFQNWFGDRANEPPILLMEAALQSKIGELYAFDIETATPEDFENALMRYDRVEEIYQAMLANDDMVKATRANLANLYYKRSLIYANLSQNRDGIDAVDDALQIVERTLADDPADQGAARLLSVLISQRMSLLVADGRPREAIAMVPQMIANKEELLAADPENRARKNELATILIMASEPYEAAGDRARACALFRRADRVRTDLRSESELTNYETDYVFEDLDPGLARNC